MNELFTMGQGDTSIEMYENLTEGYKRRKQGRARAVASAVELLNDIQNCRMGDWAIKEAIQPTDPLAAQMIERNYPGIFRFTESHTVSDFTGLTADILDRMLMGRFDRFGHNWRAYCKESRPLRDFRTVRRVPLDGLEGTWDSVPEGSAVQDAALSDTSYTYSPKVYAQAVTISMQAIMNDDLDGFMSIPDRLADSGNNTIDKFITELFMDTNGPHASLYTVGNGNIIPSNPVLSVAALQTGYTTLAAQTNSDGAPIRIDAATLVVGPQLEVTAQNIMNQILVDINEAGGTTNQRVRVNNWLVSRLTLVVNPWIPIVAATAHAAGDYPWALFANPQRSRAALELGPVRGFQTPALYQKASNALRAGGGGIDQMAGDFETMSQRYKGVLAFGGTRLEPKVTVGSNGSGS